MECKFLWVVRVYYEDTDAGGGVYHANYVAFYERARTELLRYHQLDQNTMLSNNIGFVVRCIEIDYSSPAYLDDLLNIETHITKIGKASIQFVQRIINQNGKELSCARVLVACVNLQKMKPIALPEFVATELNRWLI